MAKHTDQGEPLFRKMVGRVWKPWNDRKPHDELSGGFPPWPEEKRRPLYWLWNRGGIFFINESGATIDKLVQTRSYDGAIVRTYENVQDGEAVLVGEFPLLWDFAHSVAVDVEIHREGKPVIVINSGMKEDGSQQEAILLWNNGDEGSGTRVRYRVDKPAVACLLGGALGDALGAPVEFLKYDYIQAIYGEAGVTQMEEGTWPAGSITDDTQMTLFTAEGLQSGEGIAGVSKSYLRWLHTQRYENYHGLTCEKTGTLWNTPALHKRRAPGNTCISALQEMRTHGERANNDSKGCGGIMRVAPVALYQHARGKSAEESFQLASDIAALTHGHPSGYLAAGAFAAVLHGLLNGETLLQAIETAQQLLTAHEGHEETLHAIQQAMDLVLVGADPCVCPKAIATLGQGWIAEEALAIAVYCVGVAKDFREALILAVNHDGDSDSTGSIAGNLAGALWGLETLPGEWLAQLELKEVIIEAAARGLWEYPDKKPSQALENIGI